jgi:hypothetical protein
LKEADEADAGGRRERMGEVAFAEVSFAEDGGGGISVLFVAMKNLGRRRLAHEKKDDEFCGGEVVREGCEERSA